MECGIFWPCTKYRGKRGKSSREANHKAELNGNLRHRTGGRYAQARCMAGINAVPSPLIAVRLEGFLCDDRTASHS
jgi:hypothetical protein